MDSLIAARERELSEDREPSFDATVPRQFAHKGAVEEIFLTDVIVRESRRQVLACAQLPRSHTLHNEVENGFHDLLLILEAGRQGMTIYGHGHLEVPEGTVFVMSGLRCEVIDLEALRQGDGPAELVVDVPFGGEKRDRRGRVRGYTLRGRGEIDGRPAIDLKGTALLIREALYDRVRNLELEDAGNPAPTPVPVEPALVGRRSSRNVVVGSPERSDEGLRCALIVDTGHPTFFDHPLDHVPGMLMLESARQAALLYLGERGWPPTLTVLDACEAQFSQYAALSPPATCRVRPHGHDLGAGSAPAASAIGMRQLRAQFAQAGVDLGHVDLRLQRLRER